MYAYILSVLETWLFTGLYPFSQEPATIRKMSLHVDPSTLFLRCSSFPASWCAVWHQWEILCHVNSKKKSFTNLTCITKFHTMISVTICATLNSKSSRINSIPDLHHWDKGELICHLWMCVHVKHCNTWLRIVLRSRKEVTKWSYHCNLLVNVCFSCIIIPLLIINLWNSMPSK